MHITAVGISHKTAPIDIREKFYLDETRRRLLLSELKNNPAVVEAIVLSTCNRTEVYAHTIAPDVTGVLLQLLFMLTGSRTRLHSGKTNLGMIQAHFVTQTAMVSVMITI